MFICLSKWNPSPIHRTQQHQHTPSITDDWLTWMIQSYRVSTDRWQTPPMLYAALVNECPPCAPEGSSRTEDVVFKYNRPTHPSIHPSITMLNNGCPAGLIFFFFKYYACRRDDNNTTIDARCQPWVPQWMVGFCYLCKMVIILLSRSINECRVTPLCNVYNTYS